jgi:branched-chain amino acid transport system permease protein
MAIIAAVVAVVLLLTIRGPLAARLGPWLDAELGLRALAIGLVIYMAMVVIAITVESDGLINVDPGGWVSLVGALALFAGSRLLPLRQLRDLAHARLSATFEIAAIAATMAAILFGAAYALGLTDAWSFVLCLVFIAAIIGDDVPDRDDELVRACRPAAQDSADARRLRGRVLLPVHPERVGREHVHCDPGADLRGHRDGPEHRGGPGRAADLGYIAFLGSGAYVAAMLSKSAFATINWQPPFLVVVLVGACVAATLGLIIGSPTLRVSGDYLAIVTLGFGEIFRLAMGNLDGINGPLLTNGPNGIPGIPELQVGGFNFGDPHTVAGIELGRFSNYYFLLLVLVGFIILVFSRLNDSRIGRGWVAIREDEKAAEAMGVNVFGLKLLAFATGAFLAGIAGTIKAHQDVAVSPDQYIFLESAFLLAAVVLGGMGTIAGVLIGATILKLLPEKLRFFSEYRLLLFGLLLVLMMRFRPEGLVASRRRQLEFHEDDEGLAEAVEHDLLEEKR